MKNQFTKDYLNNGGSGVNGRSAAYANLPDTALENLNQTVLGR